MDNLDKVRNRQKSAKSAKLGEKPECKTKMPKKAAQRPQKTTERTAEGNPKTSLNSSASSSIVKSADSGLESQPKKRQLSPATLKKRKKQKKKKILGIIIKIFILLIVALIVFGCIWVALNIDFSFGDDLSSMNLNLSSTVYYTDSEGELQKYEQFVASENRIWVSVDRVPKYLKDAFVAIEDQRFYNHHGFDIKRTSGAILNYIIKGDSSYGGSTITQQLVKNITNDNEHTKARKIREILRSIVLESKISKEQILEMYMNTIYLSQGANGVEAAANVYFAKDVSELTLAESACIAGITQYPSLYDPLVNPENNAKKRKIVLDKMLELNFIDKDEYDEALNEELKFKAGKDKETFTQSYFLDHLFEEILADLVDAGYSEQFATNLIYNGGLKIYSTVDPKIQNAMEEVFQDNSSFPSLGGNILPQCAMVVSDPKTGQIKGIVGGRGKKEGNRILNRATQSTRQPGSSIKPLAVYGPSIDLGLITPGTSVDDSYLEIDGWTPKNSDNRFRGYVTVKNAIAFSYNIPAVRILENLTVDKSFHYLKDKLHISTLVLKDVRDGKVYSDKNLSSLALGGLTNGVTVMDMNSAYCTFANEGMYVEPSVYTKIYDADGRILLEKKPKSERAFSKETAYIMNTLLKGVVEFGTGVGAQISNMDTCGKSGTTDDAKDRWFIGYTPYYVGSVWFGYDVQKTISAGGNPALNVWKKVMTKIHEPLSPKHFEMPNGVESLSVCTNTGKKPSASCSRTTVYANKKFALEQCSGKHEYIGTRSYNQNRSSNSSSQKKTESTSENTTSESGESGHQSSEGTTQSTSRTNTGTQSGSSAASTHEEAPPTSKATATVILP